MTYSGGIMRLKNSLRAATGLQLLLLVAAIAVQEFSMKRMGMMRHMMFLNQEWESNLPLEAIKYGITLLIILLFAAVTARFLASEKQKPERKLRVLWLTTGLITLAPILFSKLYSAESYRTYYIMGLVLAAIAVIQNIKGYVVLKINRP